MSTSSTRSFKPVEKVMRREKPDFIEINYSLEDREAERRVIPTAAEVGIAVVADLPFGRGWLFRAVRGWQLPDWAAEFDAHSWTQFFSKFLISNPVVTAIIIPGTGDPAQVRENVDTARGRLPDAAQRQRMVQFFESLN